MMRKLTDLNKYYLGDLTSWNKFHSCWFPLKKYFGKQLTEESIDEVLEALQLKYILSKIVMWYV